MPLNAYVALRPRAENIVISERRMLAGRLIMNLSKPTRANSRLEAAKRKQPDL